MRYAFQVVRVVCFSRYTFISPPASKVSERDYPDTSLHRMTNYSSISKWCYYEWRILGFPAQPRKHWCWSECEYLPTRSAAFMRRCTPASLVLSTCLRIPIRASHKAPAALSFLMLYQLTGTVCCGEICSGTILLRFRHVVKIAI